MIEYLNEQGSDEWIDARRGVMTRSVAKIARERTKKGEFTAASRLLAQDIAREQLGGISSRKYQSYQMRLGQEEESNAFAEYENQRFEFPKQTGLITTIDRLYGCSPDGLVGSDGGIEIKTMVSSDSLFSYWATGDVSEFKDQCLMAMWLLNRQWWDVCLWAYDMPEKLKIVRIERHEPEIETLIEDLDRFMQLVNQYKKMINSASIDYHNGHVLAETVESRPWVN